MHIIIWILGIVGGYLLGSISSAILVCRLLRLPDPRSEGSKNPGTTNVLRIGGRFAAVLTLLGDALKGALPVFLVKMLVGDPLLELAVLLAAVCGHIYPIFFQFKGGKGVATTIGGIAALSLPLGAIFVLTWLSMFALWRYSSLSALIAMASMPFWGWVLYDIYYAIGLGILALVVFWHHQSNIERLLKGQEGKFSFKRS